MKTHVNVQKIFAGTLPALFSLLLFSGIAVGQTEKLGIVAYTPVKGWTKSAKENIVTFSDLDQKAGNFCFITLYGATPSAGTPQADFENEWSTLVVKPFGALTNPQTVTEPADGWTGIAGGAPVDFQGTKAYVFLTVISGYGKTVSVLGLLNNDSYLPQLTAFVTGMDIEKERPSVAAAPADLQYDAYGRLLIPLPTRQLTITDLAGEWGQNDGINTRYVYRDSGTYAGADSLHFSNKMTLTAQGGYYNDFFAIQNGKKIKEDTSGSFGVVGRILVIKDRNTRKFVIRGWLELPDMTILEVCGPWYNDDVIPAEIFTNPDHGANLNSKWVRKK